jgi:hypothetical protein
MVNGRIDCGDSQVFGKRSFRDRSHHQACVRLPGWPHLCLLIRTSPRISNRQIPRLEVNLTLAKSTRASVLIANFSRFAIHEFRATQPSYFPLANSISNRNIARLETHLTSAKSIRVTGLIATNDDLTRVVVLLAVNQNEGRDQREPKDLPCASNRRKPALRAFDLSRSPRIESIRR